MNVLDNSTQKCDFLRMCSKGMFGLISVLIVRNPVCRTAQSALHSTP